MIRDANEPGNTKSLHFLPLLANWEQLSFKAREVGREEPPRGHGLSEPGYNSLLALLSVYFFFSFILLLPEPSLLPR